MYWRWHAWQAVSRLWFSGGHGLVVDNVVQGCGWTWAEVGQCGVGEA